MIILYENIIVALIRSYHARASATGLDAGRYLAGTGTTGKMTTYLFLVIVVTRKLLHKQFHRWRDFPTWKRA